MLRESEPGETAQRESFWRRHRWLKWFGGTLLLILVLLGIGVAIAVHRAEPFLRALIVDRLQERFNAHVELDSFHVSLARGLRAEGKGLRIWPPAQVEGVQVEKSGAHVKPLIDLSEFHFRAPLRFAPGRPIHIWTVSLEGLNVDIPSKPHKANGAGKFAGRPELPLPRAAALLHFRVDQVVCTQAHITIENANPAKLPLVFDIQTVKVEHLNARAATDFQAVLTNPKPRGLIVTDGRIGPWAVDDPAGTPLRGHYRFEHADLGTFKGIAGLLNSTGQYDGTLRDLTVDGETDTPNFSLTHFGTPLPLHTTFHARVDATNGDTWLQPVRATLGGTHFTAAGKIVQVLSPADPKDGPQHSVGHEIALNVDVERGQIADFLKLASHSGEPLLTGMLHMKTTFDLPPGHIPVHERVRMKGSFALSNALFTNPKLQDRIGQMSLRGQGKPNQAKTPAVTDVRSAMKGDFTMAGGAINLPSLQYSVPGADIRLNGVYGLDGGTLAFRGTARLQATVSKLVGGWKGWLLKPVDPFFRKNGAGTVLRVHINGTRRDPHFGVDF